jgi:hypothetical protein
MTIRPIPPRTLPFEGLPPLGRRRALRTPLFLCSHSGENTPQNGNGCFTADDILGTMTGDVDLHHIAKFGFENQIDLG